MAGTGVEARLYWGRYAFDVNVWTADDTWLAQFRRGWYPGQDCLAGIGGEFALSGSSPTRLDYGIVRSDAASVHIFMTDGSSATAAISDGEAWDVRSWIGIRPAGTLDRYEARDADGNVLHVATAPTFDAMPDTC